jgi:hypothetical protein
MEELMFDCEKLYPIDHQKGGFQYHECLKTGSLVSYILTHHGVDKLMEVFNYHCINGKCDILDVATIREDKDFSKRAVSACQFPDRHRTHAIDEGNMGYRLHYNNVLKEVLLSGSPEEISHVVNLIDVNSYEKREQWNYMTNTMVVTYGVKNLDIVGDLLFGTLVKIIMDDNVRVREDNFFHIIRLACQHKPTYVHYWFIALVILMYKLNKISYIVKLNQIFHDQLCEHDYEEAQFSLDYCCGIDLKHIQM